MNLNFNDFKQLAINKKFFSEKIGFDESTRNQNDDLILIKDVFEKVSKNHPLGTDNISIFDIGCGCSYFAQYLQKISKANNYKLYMLDSHEMLMNLEDTENTIKIPCEWPFFDDIKQYEGGIDLVIMHSVIQHIYGNCRYNFYAFIDEALKLLNDNGVLFIGHIPNQNNINRAIINNQINGMVTTMHENQITDQTLMDILKYYRDKGYQSYLLPSSVESKTRTRENIMIYKNI